MKARSPSSGWREHLHEVIFEADTKAGKTFDVVLLFLIMFSIVVVMLSSVEEYRLAHGKLFYAIEWSLTVLFSLEYGARIVSVRKPTSYIFSFFGVVDLLSLIPTYLSLFVLGSEIDDCHPLSSACSNV